MLKKVYNDNGNHNHEHDENNRLGFGLYSNITICTLANSSAPVLC